MVVRKRIARIIVGLTLLASCGGASKYTSPQQWVDEAAQPGRLPLAAKAGVWSASKTQPLGSGEVAIRSKFLEHKGTTCTYEVELKNLSGAPLSERIGIVKPDDPQVHENNSVSASLTASETAVWELEHRECRLTFGSSTEMGKCAECEPVLKYVGT